jgi:flagellar protein FliS
MTADQYNQYHQNAVTQADPIKLVGMLYDGAIRFVRRALKAIADGDPEDAHHNIMKAYAVVAELTATLDFEKGGEIAPKLEQCYDYILYLLKEANIKKDARQLSTVLSLLEPLAATWREAFAAGMPREAEEEAAAEGAKPPVPKKSLNVVG